MSKTIIKLFAYITIILFGLVAMFILNKYQDYERKQCENKGGTFIDGYGMENSCVYDRSKE